MNFVVLRERTYRNSKLVSELHTWRDMIESSRCLACHEPTLWSESYMVRDHIWESVTKMENGRGRLHCVCLERRLGRSLTYEDFTVPPMCSNYYVGKFSGQDQGGEIGRSKQKALHLRQAF
jgi:hypothetical protein